MENTMHVIEEILENGLTQGACIAAIATALVYVWKRYERLLKDKAKNSIEAYNLMKTVQDISEDTKKVVNEVNKTVGDLQSEISNLDDRLKDLERLGFVDQTNINVLIKDIETIKKYMELYNIAISIKQHRDQR